MNKRKHKLGLLLVTVLTSCIFLSNINEVFASNKPNKTVLASIQGNDTDWVFDFEKTSDGGYIAVGQTESNDLGLRQYGQEDSFIAKYDSDFNRQWIKTWGGSDDEYFTHVTETSDGGFVGLGYVQSSDISGISLRPSGYDIAVVKFSRNGNLVWNKNFGATDSTTPGGIAELKNGNIIVASYSSNGNSGRFEGYPYMANGDFNILCLNSSGNTQWVKIMGSHSIDYPNAVTATPDGGFVIAGQTGTPELGAVDSYDAYIGKFDANGNRLWQDAFNEDGFMTQEDYYDVKSLPNGNIVVVGHTDPDERHPFMRLYSSSGTLLAEDIILTDGTYWDLFEKVSICNDKIYVLGGISSQNIQGDPVVYDSGGKILIAVYDFNGNRELLKVVNDTSIDGQPGGIEVDKDGDIVVGLSMHGSPPNYTNAGGMDFFAITFTPYPDSGVDIELLNPIIDWTNNDVTLKIEVENPKGQLSHVILPDGNTTIQERFEYIVTQNGKYTFIAVDINGIEYELEVDVETIDRTPPRFDSLDVRYPNNLIHGDISFSASDDLSGIDIITKPDGTTTNNSNGTHRVITNEVFQFIATDKAGNSTSATIKVDRVNMRHVLTMTNELKPGYLEKRGIVEIEATLDDAENDEAEIKYSINDAYQYTLNGTAKPNGSPVNLNISFQLPPTLPPGNHTLKLWAEDKVLKTSSNVLVLALNVYDNTPHHLTVNPLNAEYFVGETVNVSGTISDEDGDEAVIKYSIDDRNVQELPSLFKPENGPIDYSFSFTVPESSTDGSHSLKIWAIDTENPTRVSNILDLELKTVGDFVPPSIVANPEERLEFERTGLNVDVSFADSGFSGFDAYRYVVSGEMNRPIQWSQWIAKETDTIYIDGSHMNYLHIEARDNDGNVGYRVFGTYNIDNEPPSIDYEVDNSDFTNQDVTLTIQTADNQGGSGIDFITLPDGNTMQSEMFDYTVTTNGSYTFSVIDNVGLTSSVTVTVSNIDKEAPDINFTLSETGYTNQNVIITAEAIDNGVSGVQSMFLPDLTTITNTRVDFTATDNDTYEFTVEDKAGNSATKTIVIDKMDKVIPTIKVNVDKIENRVATLIVEASDNLGLAELTTATGEVVPISGQDYYVELTTNVHGTANFSVKDLAGNTNSTSIYVDLANIPIPDSGINRIEYKLEGATEQDWTVYTAPFFIANEGTTIVKAKCFDNAGNESDEIFINVNTDKTKPHKNLISIAPIHINKN